MLKNVCGVAALAMVLVVVSGCDTKRRADRALDNANKLVVEYKRLGENLNKTISDLRAAAQTSAKQSPALAAKVSPIPSAVTGGVDVVTEQPGKSGTKASNVDGVGNDEQVGVFVPDGEQDASPALVSWEGDAESDDQGVCYLAWEKGSTEWFVASACGAEDGGYVCQVEGESVSCSACNVEGQCTPCDLESEEFECTWPGAAAPADSTSADGE